MNDNQQQYSARLSAQSEQETMNGNPEYQPPPLVQYQVQVEQPHFQQRSSFQQQRAERVQYPASHTHQQAPHDQMQQEEQFPPPVQHDYEEPHPDEPPPSYDGPGVSDEGMDKERPLPLNLTEVRGRERDPRQRQASLGILQHPQPASMAASPSRSSADMGAEALRRQLLRQEETDRVERLQRAEVERMESERERQERDMARARARELERSVSGGGQVGSLRSVGGSGRGRGLGWERRGSMARPVFELSAEEDDEPVMRATSFPGQEWVPTFTED